MFKTIQLKDGLRPLKPVEVMEYCFHDPAGKAGMLRSTIFAYLVKGINDTSLRLFIGASHCSEGDQFQRVIGRMQAKDAAEIKVIKWLKGKKIDPEVTFSYVLDNNDDWKILNHEVQDACLVYQLCQYRLLLKKRYDIIGESSKW